MILPVLSSIHPIALTIFTTMFIASLAWLIMAGICIKGCNWTYVLGFSKKVDSERFDLVSMNRYIGKMMLLPHAAYVLIMLSIIHLFSPLSGHNWLNIPGYIWLLVIALISTITLLGLYFYAVQQLRGARFMR